MIDAGDLLRTDGEYPVLQLTKRSKDLLTSERQAVLVLASKALEAKPQRTRKSKRRGGSSSPVRSSDGDGAMPDQAFEPLFDHLRSLRREIARELGMPPYIVCSDVTLEQMASERPRDEQGLLRIKGIGPKKAEAFGERFLRAIREFGAD